MKITKEHKKVFKQALEFWEENVMNFLCVLIDRVKAPHGLKHECKEIINHYFNPVTIRSMSFGFTTVTNFHLTKDRTAA